MANDDHVKADQAKKPGIIQRATAAIAGKAEAEEKLAELAAHFDQEREEHAEALARNAQLAIELTEVKAERDGLKATAGELAQEINSLKAELELAQENAAAAADSAKAQAAEIVGEQLGVSVEELPEKLETGEQAAPTTKEEAWEYVNAADKQTEPEERRRRLREVRDLLRG